MPKKLDEIGPFFDKPWFFFKVYHGITGISSLPGHGNTSESWERRGARMQPPEGG